MLTPIAPPNHWPTRTTSSTSVTLGAGDATVLCNNTSDATVSLPSAATVPGQIFAVKKIGNNAHTVTLDPNGSETIDGATSYVLYVVGDYVVIQSDGTAWRVIGGYLTPHKATLVRTTPQTIANDTRTKVTFNALTANVGGIGSTDTSRVTARRSGTYLLSTMYSWYYPPETVNSLQVFVYVNGAEAGAGTLYTGPMTSMRARLDFPLDLQAGDYVEVYYYQWSGVSRNTLTSPADRPYLTVVEMR